MSDNWQQTYTGVAFEPLHPRVDDVNLDDIAHALSNLCRFTGHTRRFYSVAEHCCRVYDCVFDALCDFGLADSPFGVNVLRWALLHDAAEVYVNDLARPIKHAPGMEEYKAIERRLLATISVRFRLNGGMPKEVIAADNILLMTEARYLLGPKPQSWGDYLMSLTPLVLPWWERWSWSPWRIGWSPRRARREFKRRALRILRERH